MASGTPQSDPGKAELDYKDTTEGAQDPTDGADDLLPLLQSLLNLPKWCFNFLGSYFSMNSEETPKDPPMPAPPPFIPPEVVITEVPEKSIIEEMIAAIFSHFPAKLVVGEVEEDLWVISMVLLSAIVASFTSIFIVYIYGLFKFQQEDLAGGYDGREEDGNKKKMSKFFVKGPKLAFQNGGEDCGGIDGASGGKSDDCRNCNLPTDSLVTLHQFPRGKYVPCFDLEGMKIETVLRLAKIPHKIIFDCDNTGPWIEHAGKIVWGSRTTLNFLAKNFPRKVTPFLVSRELEIQAHFIALHVENELCWLLYHWRWFYGIHHRDENFAWSNIPSEYVELAASSWNRKFGDVPIESIVEYLRSALHVLSQVLGGNEYFVGDQLSMVDVTVFAAISQALWGMPASAVEGLVFAFPNLVELCERIRAITWSDWSDQLTSSKDSHKESEPGESNFRSSDPKDSSQDGREDGGDMRNLNKKSRTRPLSKSTVPFYCPPEVSSSVQKAQAQSHQTDQKSERFATRTDRESSNGSPWNFEQGDSAADSDFSINSEGELGITKVKFPAFDQYEATDFKLQISSINSTGCQRSRIPTRIVGAADDK